MSGTSFLACQENDDKLLEEQLSQPRNPNFEDADGKTPLYVATKSLEV